MFEGKLRERYHILEILGTGASGELYLARDNEDDELVALKQFRGGQAHVQAALKEASIIQGLKHPNLVRCLDFFEDESAGLYLIYEYINGRSLRSFMEKRELSKEQILDCISQVLSGLEFLHGLGVIHCDLKPENVLSHTLADGTQQYKIVDFDGAVFDGNIPEGGSVEGSPAYMAPERFDDAFSFSSDLYSIGIMLFELLTGKRPFSGNAAQLAIAHQFRRPVFEEVEDLEFRALLERLLVSEDKRIQTPSEVLACLPQQQAPTSQQDGLDFQKQLYRVDVRALSYTVCSPATSGSLEELGDIFIKGDIKASYLMNVKDQPFLGILNDDVFEVYNALTGRKELGDVPWGNWDAYACNPYSLMYHTASTIRRFDFSTLKENILIEGLEHIDAFCYGDESNDLLWTDARIGHYLDLNGENRLKFPCLNFGVKPHLRFGLRGRYFYTNGPIYPALNILDREGAILEKHLFEHPVISVSQGVQDWFFVTLVKGQKEPYELYFYSLDEGMDKAIFPEGVQDYSMFGHYFVALMETGALRTYSSINDYVEIDLHEVTDYTSVLNSLDNRFIFLKKQEAAGARFLGYRNYE